MPRLTLAILFAISLFAIAAPEADARIFRRLGSRVFAACSQQGSPTPACSAPAASLAVPAGVQRSVVRSRTAAPKQVGPNLRIAPQPLLKNVCGPRGCH